MRASARLALIFRGNGARLAAIVALLATSALEGSTAHAQAAPLAQQTVNSGGVSSYVLPNGFKVILFPHAPSDRIRVHLVVKSGNKVEGYGEAGMAHLLEHMLFKSAGKRLDVKQDLTRLGAEWNGFTSADSTQYFSTIPADQGKLEELLNIEADRFISASFTPEHLKSEMTVVRNELEQNDTNPGSIVARTLWRQSFSTHGYGRATIGARSDIENAPFEALQAFHKRNYRPDNAFLLVSGEFDVDQTSALINKLFAQARNPATPRVQTWTREPAQTLNTRAELVLPAGQVMAASAWKLPPDFSRELVAFQLAKDTICSSDWGSLRKELVLNRKIASSAFCSTDDRKDASLFIAAASGGKQDDPDKISKELVAHIEKAARDGITQEDLDRAKLQMQNWKEEIASNPAALPAYLVEGEIAGDWRLILWNLDVVHEISLAEVNAALAKWIAPFGRSDVLLRHQDQASSPEIPLPVMAADLIGSKTWPPFHQAGDPLPRSLDELQQATRYFRTEDGTRLALVSRKTRGDKIWFRLRNHYGNPDYRFKHGLACALTDQLMSLGGGGYDLDQFNAAMTRLNAQGNAGMDGINLRVGRKDFPQALDLLLKVWRTPALPETEFNTAKASLLASVDAAVSDPGTVASKEVSFRFDNHPDGHPSKPKTFARSREDIQALTHEDVKSCWTEMAGLSHYMISVVGNMTREELLSLWETRIKALPRGRTAYERTRAIKPPAPVDTSLIVVQMPNKPSANIQGAGLLPVTDSNPDFAALRLAFNILGHGAESRIWKRLRETDGLAYSASASLVPNALDPRSFFAFSATAASGNWKKALDALKEEVARALEYGFTEHEVEFSRKEWLNGRRHFLANEGGYIGALDAYLDHERDPFQFMIKYDAAMSRLTATDVTAAFKKHVQFDMIVWSVGGGS